MSTLLDEPQSELASGACQRLRSTMAAARLSFTWLGARKSLTAQQKNRAADSFGAEGNSLSAGKKLLDTSHPAFKAVTAVRSNAISFWKEVSLPFPEAGVRLIRQDSVARFDQRIARFGNELDQAVATLDRHYDELRRAAEDRLGELFDRSDYPPTLIGMFSIQHDYPSVEPPDYLLQLDPALYRQECQRVQDRFNEAVELAEQGFLGELAKLVEHLAERLSGQVDGKPKVFRDSALTNITDFFERFGQLNIHSSDQLDELVTNAQQVFRGVNPSELRGSQWLRDLVSEQLTDVQTSLDGLLVDRPRRNIVRPPR